ncbi:DUF4249 family protein [Rhodocytophaga aerolata]|uniref:DUF4249 family protein n=1 Tax=Rhodocytophaga aerolata TaxID=455078 RepID=A0ABT8RH72_9BACT|nr:DUF4249 family protein [Rhodocytophaga aerolata]MDO1451456.1 DUF4249 family protein [Rhodocytophaga aerolata]
MNKVIRTMLVLLLMLMGACKKDLGVELPYEGERLIIYGLISADSVVSVKIDKTASPTGTFMYGEGINDATVAFFEEGVFMENLHPLGKGIYRSPSGRKPQVGKGYSLRVEALGFPTAETSNEVIPRQVSISSYIFQDTVSSLFVGETARKLAFTFADEEKELDLYYAKIEGQYQGKYVALNTFRPDRPLEASEDICSFKSEDNQYVLSDICFNGQSFTFDIGVAMAGALQDSTDTAKRLGQNVACDKIFLHFRKISPVYRNYLYRAGWEDEGFLKAFTTPIREYTNVKGGYGLWAAYSEEVVDILH